MNSASYFKNESSKDRDLSGKSNDGEDYKKSGGFFKQT